MSDSINLLGLSRQKLEAFLQDLGEKPFRAVQLLKWIHQHGVIELDEMSNIGKSLRAKLKAHAVIAPPRVKERRQASDGCRKWIVEVASGSSVEAIFIPEAGRGTLCVSSQAGCSLDCKFCATGKQGFNSDLETAEIIGQLWLANRELNGFARSGRRLISNVVMMGMGEPLLNFDNVMDALSLMLDDNCYGLSRRRVTISTAGVVPAIDRLKDHTQASLAVSLHAPNDALRDEIVPLNRKYPIRELLRSVKGYLDALPDKRSAFIEYVLLAGVNDHQLHARQLAKLLNGLSCKINLIPLNEFAGCAYRRPDQAAIGAFRQILQNAGYTVTVRATRGDDIDAACGQLRGRVEDITRRSSRHLALRAIG